MTGLASGVMTLFLIILFLGIVFWAYSRRNKSTFDKMAQLPLAENESKTPSPQPLSPERFDKNGAFKERGAKDKKETSDE